VCEPACPSLVAPEFAVSCNKQLLLEQWGPASNLTRWQISPRIPAAVAANYWNISNGVLPGHMDSPPVCYCAQLRAEADACPLARLAFRRLGDARVGLVHVVYLEVSCVCLLSLPPPPHTPQ
jgi:hypothetical protein